MNNHTVLHVDAESKSPTLNHPQEPEPRKTAHPNLARELQELQEVRETLVGLPCSPQIQPIVDGLSDILDLAHNGGGIDVERLWALLCAVRKGVAPM